MTYARARLWLGITGVGSLVTLACAALATDLPQQWLSNEIAVSDTQILELACFTLGFVAALTPLDFLGGFWLPRTYKKSTTSFGAWLSDYLPAVAWQSILFIAFGLLTLLLSQSLGLTGTICSIVVATMTCWVTRTWMIMRRQTLSEQTTSRVKAAVELTQQLGIKTAPVVVTDHRDIGYTGGIIGFGRQSKVVIPTQWTKFPTEHLATVIARRSIAISQGSYQRGLILAFLWNISGFLICTLLPNAGASTVAQLATTICGFTLWSFVGLLILPTVSRNASLKIDHLLNQAGFASEQIVETANRLDQLQDGEPERSAWIEAIFHPVPNVSSRNSKPPTGRVEAWNVARTTLFFSWACLGLLSRAVHCNVGRPELWTMLPTD